MGIVLLVDDEPAIVSALGFLLEADGHEAMSAHNGVEALRSALARTPDVVVTDWLMPVLGGAGLFECFMRYPRLRSVPFVFMSGTAQALETFGAPILRKPFDATRLIETVAQCLSSKGRGPPPRSIG